MSGKKYQSLVGPNKPKWETRKNNNGMVSDTERCGYAVVSEKEMTDKEIEQIAIAAGCYYTAVDRNTGLLVLRPSLYRFAYALLEAQEKDFVRSGRLSDSGTP